MYPKYHVFFGLILAVILYFVFPDIKIIGATLIFFSSFLIDFDHYIAYVYNKKDFSIKKSLEWNYSLSNKFKSLNRENRNNYYSFICFLHGFEILFIILLLTIFASPTFLFILTGFTFHLTLDTFHQTFYWDRMDKLSIIYDHFKFKKLKKIEL
jgi:hypothetical protein